MCTYGNFSLKLINNIIHPTETRFHFAFLFVTVGRTCGHSPSVYRCKLGENSCLGTNTSPVNNGTPNSSGGGGGCGGGNGNNSCGHRSSYRYIGSNAKFYRSFNSSNGNVIAVGNSTNNADTPCSYSPCVNRPRRSCQMLVFAFFACYSVAFFFLSAHEIFVSIARKSSNI